jgi:hypothetical protein
LRINHEEIFYGCEKDFGRELDGSKEIVEDLDIYNCEIDAKLITADKKFAEAINDPTRIIQFSA